MPPLMFASRSAIGSGMLIPRATEFSDSGSAKNAPKSCKARELRSNFGDLPPNSARPMAAICQESVSRTGVLSKSGSNNKARPSLAPLRAYHSRERHPCASASRVDTEMALRAGIRLADQPKITTTVSVTAEPG